MPEMPGQVPERISISEQPRSAVTGQDVASPYEQLGNALDKSGHALEDISTEMATQAGYKAVVRDADGKVQVQPAAYLGPAAIAYRRAANVAYAAEMDGAAKRKDIELRKQYRDDPDQYQVAAENYRRGVQAEAEKAVGPEGAAAIGKMVEQTTTATYRGLLNEKESLDLQKFKGNIDAQIASEEDDLKAMVRGGAPFDSGPALDKIKNIQMLRGEMVGNPRMAYTNAQARLDNDHLLGELGAGRFLYQTNEVYQKGWDPLTGKAPDTPPDVETRAQQALTFAKGILSNPNLKLTEQQRIGYYHQAEAEIRVNEAERKQDINQWSVAERDLQTAVALGIPLDFQRVQQIEDGYNKLGAFSRASALLAWAARAPSVNKHGLQSLPDQTRTLQELEGQALPSGYMEAIKQSEGFEPVAKWDYKQYTSGYGTRAQGPGEQIGREEAERRFNREISNAAAIVDQVNPNLPAGARAALTSLTFNAGDAWTRSGLGERVRAGDMEGARDRFLQYSKAGGETNPGLVARREREAQWFTGAGVPAGAPAGVTSLTPGVAVGAGLSAPAAMPLTAPPLTSVRVNLDAAKADLNLTPQEQSFYERHLANLYGPGGVDNPDGSRSTVLETTVERDGKTYIIPTVWEGKILPAQEAIKRVEEEGWDRFPSYKNEEEAEARYQKIHAYFDKDTTAYFDRKKATTAVPPLSSTGALPSGLSPSVAQAARMSLSRSLDSEEMKRWTPLMEEWKKTGARPSEQDWNEIYEAAKASGNDVLLDKMAKDRDNIDAVQRLAQGSLAGQDAVLADMRQKLAAGTDPSLAEFVEQATKRTEQIRKGLAEDAPATVAANFPDRPGIFVPPPLNLANDQELMAGLQYRTKLSLIAANNWQVPTPSALGKGDLAAISAVLKQGTIQDKIRILGALTHGLTDRNVRNATLTALGEKGTGESEALLAGDMMDRAPNVSESILRGQDALAVDKRYGPAATDEELHWNQEMDKRLPATAFSIEGRTKPGGSYDMFAKSVKAVYADISQRMGDTSGVVKPQRLQDAVNMVTGGVLTHNGAPLIAPVYGMSQSDFDRTLFGVTDKDLEGVTTQNGQPLTKEYLRSTAQLESRSDGTYRILLGRDPMNPIYAFRPSGLGPPIQPRPFVLDLRNRPMAPFFVPGPEESMYRPGP